MHLFVYCDNSKVLWFASRLSIRIHALLSNSVVELVTFYFESSLFFQCSITMRKVLFINLKFYAPP